MSQQKFKKILLLICDQFRYPRHWGGPDRRHRFTPNLNKLRENGIEFVNTYIASAACNASRACIYTGKYGQETGVTSTSGFGNETSGNPLEPGKEEDGISWLGYHPSDPQCSLPHDTVIKTLGTHFRENDFRAIYKGKWHLSEVEGGWPNKPYDAEGLEAYGFEGWNPPEGHGSTTLRMGMGADTSYVQDAVDTLYELKDTNYKWFMAVNLINPHDVGFFNDWSLTIPDMGVRLPANHEDDLKNKPFAQNLGKWYWNHNTFGGFAPTEEDWKRYNDFYAYLIQHTDFNVGIILQALKDSGQLKDTLVVFLSDHGEMGGSHEMTQKWYQSYEETIHVPLIFSNPRFKQRGGEPRTTECMASLIDIAPTLLSQAGIERPHGEDALRGRNLSPVLEDPENEDKFPQDAVLFVTDDDIVGSIFEDLTVPERARKKRGDREADRKYLETVREELRKLDALNCPRFLRTIRTRDHWNLTQYTHVQDKNGENPGDEWELYDLKHDPGQMTNLANNPEHKSKLDELKLKLFDLLDQKYFKPSLRECEDGSGPSAE